MTISHSIFALSGLWENSFLVDYPYMSSLNERHVASARRLFFISCFVLLITVGFIYKVQDNWLRIRPFPSGDADHQNDAIMSTTIKSNGNISIKQYAACPIPQLEPFDKSIVNLLDERPTLDCEDNYPRLFDSTLESTIIPVGKYIWERYESCCYRTVERDERATRPDDTERTSDTCFPLALDSPTKVPEGHEFIGIFCRRHGNKTLLEPVDAHAFVHLKPKTGVNKDGGSEIGEKLNVIIFGMDSTSRMNFIRVMPQSYAFLKEELGGVEMLGYNKVGESTLPFVMAMLTSQNLSELGCISEERFSNDCPFIWKEYSKQGYYTSFAEDAPDMAIFNYLRKGFSRQPTDYYLRPLSSWAEANVSFCLIGPVHACYGPRLTFQYLLNYMEKFVDLMNRSMKHFFQFTFATALTHDSQSSAKYGDAPLFNSLKWLKDSGHLNNTVFILVSDHGYRMGSFRNSIQGQLEDRLPLLFFVVPDSFKKKNHRAYQNLLTNRDKLVTPFDIHATLEDILNLTRIQDTSLQRRELETYSAEKGASLPRQLSLFLPIPESRTCAMAGIDVTFCSCNYLELTSLQDPILEDVAQVGVSYLNSNLDNVNQIRCAQLQLKNVTMAQHTGNSSINWEAYLINFETEPGGGQFEAVIGKTEEGDQQDWSVQNKIIRTNWYGNQSHCVDDRTLKSYCYCLD